MLFLFLLLATARACDDLKSCLFSGNDLFDLSHEFHHDTIYWPDSRRFEWTNKREGIMADGSWYAANDFCAGEHGGTHMDAPYHFSQNGSKVGDIPLEKLILPLYIMDLSSQVMDNGDFVLYKQHVDSMLNVFDTSKPALLVIKFGWSKFYKEPRRYLGMAADNSSTLKFPGLSGEMAEFIVSHRNIAGVGVDTASVDPGASTDFAAHKTLMGAGLYAIENVKLDVPVPGIKCVALVMPMKIKTGTGAPLRLVAICPKQDPPQRFRAKDFY